MKIYRIISAALLALAIPAAATAAIKEPSDSISTRIARKGELYQPEMDEKVIVGSDTINMIIPEHNFGRYDRGLFNWLFIPKKQWTFGLMASYAQFDAKDVEILQALKDFDIDGKQYAIRPYMAYFFRHNQCVGLKFDFTRQEADLGRLAVNLGDDLSFDIHDISYYSSNYSIGVFYRNYVGLRLKRSLDGKLRDTRTDLTQVALNFSPGLCMFIMDYISFNVSFGVFGIHLTNEKQITDGVEEGPRFSSGANFRFNLFNINFGIGVHI